MTTTVNGVGYQDDVLSKPLNDDLNTLASAANNLQDQINNLTTPPAGSEVPNARDYHDVLRDRIRSNSNGIGSVLISGGVISESGTPDMNINISDVVALVDGVGIDKTSITPIAITAPGSNTRLDYVVVNSDNTISVLPGTPAASPVFPNVASSQLVIGALVVKNTTTSLNDNVEIFNFVHTPNQPDIYVGSATTWYQSTLNCGNVIVDAALTINTAYNTGLSIIQQQKLAVNCIGNYYFTTNASIVLSASGNILYGANAGTAGQNDGTAGAGGAAGTASDFLKGYHTGIGGAGGGRNTAGGGGGGGGSSYISAGGAGGAASGGSGGPTAGNAGGAGGSLIVIIAENIYIYGNFDVSGTDGTDGPTNKTGGGGGGAGSVLILSALNTIEINTGVTVDLSGGDGGDTTDEAGAGGGGAGGQYIARSLTYTNNGTVTVSAGAGGIASGAGANGTAGTAGNTYQSLWNNVNTDQFNTILPFNGIELDLLKRIK